MKIFLKIILFILIGFLIPIFFYLNIALAINENLIINEIMYDPKDSDTDNEWVEILNIGSQNIVLNKNWRFVDSKGNHIINEPAMGDFILEPNEYAIFTQDTQLFLNRYPNFNGTIIKVALYLKNTSDTLKILDNQKNEIATLTYSKEFGGSENNKTLEVIDPLNPTILKESLVDFGTPGRQNSVYQQQINQQQETNQQNSNQENPPLQNSNSDNQQQIQIINNEQNNNQSPENNQPPLNEVNNEKSENQNELQLTNSNQNQTNPAQINKIFFNEILPNPSGDDSQYEWIEIYNENEIETDLSSWQIKSDDKIFKIPQNTKISAKSFLIFSRPTTKITLSNEGGVLELLDDKNNIIQKLNYPKTPKENYSFARDKNDNWEFTSIPTPASANIFQKDVKGIKKDIKAEINNQKQTISKQNIANILESLNKSESNTSINNLNKNLSQNFWIKTIFAGIILGAIMATIILFIKIKIIK